MIDVSGNERSSTGLALPLRPARSALLLSGPSPSSMAAAGLRTDVFSAVHINSTFRLN
jgi:hypothetical protein